MTDCIFCKISNNQIPSVKLFEDEHFFIVNDIDPKAKLHYLAIPKKHYKGLADMQTGDADILGHIFSAIGMLEGQLKLQKGYRLIINQGDDGGQTVNHLHIHILGAQRLEFDKF